MLILLFFPGDYGPEFSGESLDERGKARLYPAGKTGAERFYRKRKLPLQVPRGVP